MADGPVRYIITVDKLREGWDCPLAYVLGSIGNAATATAVEQLIGRVLRMPNANPTRVPALDRAYAFVLSDDVLRTAMQLRDRMVETLRLRRPLGRGRGAGHGRAESTRLGVWPHSVERAARAGRSSAVIGGQGPL